MSKAVIKFLSALVSLFFLISAFTGCTGGAKPESTSSVATTSATATETAESSQQPAVKELEEMKFSMLIPTQTLTQLPLVETIPFQSVMQKFNVKFEMTEMGPTQEFYDKVKLLIGTQEIPDFMVSGIQRNEANLYGPQGAFVELSAYMDKLPELKKVLDSDPNSKYNAYSFDDKLYFAPMFFEVPTPSFELSYVKNEFEAAGFAALNTWDDVYNALKALKAKYPDSFPFMYRGAELGANSTTLRDHLLLSFMEGKTGNGIAGFDYDQKKFILVPEHTGYKECIQYLNKLYEEKLLDPEFLTTDMAALHKKLNGKKGFMLADWVGGLSGLPDAQAQVNNGLYPLTLPASTSGKVIMGIDPARIIDWGTTLSFKLTGDRLDRALAVLNYFYSDEFYSTLYTHPDVMTEKDGKKVYIDKIYDNDGATMDKYIPWALMSAFRIDYNIQVKPDNIWGSWMYNEYFNTANKDKILPTLILPFTEDENKKLGELLPTINDAINRNIDLFILGKKPMEEWDQFIKEVKQAGGDEYVSINNEVYAKYFK